MRITTSFLFASALAISTGAARADIDTMEPAATADGPRVQPSPSASEPPRPDDHGGHALRASGIAMTVVGGINAALGGLGFVMGQGQVGCERPCPSSAAQRWGIGMMIGGGAVMLAGIPVLVIGARRIERYQGESARVLPVVAISPRGATLAWSF